MTIEITPQAVLAVTGILAGLWLLAQIKAIILILFIACILASALSPLVNRFGKKGIPRVLSVSLVYILIFGALSLLGLLIVPPLLRETQRFFAQFPKILESLITVPGVVDAFLARMADVSADLLRLTLGVASNIVNLLAILVFAFYLLLEWEALRDKFLSFFPRDHQRVKKLLELVEEKLGAWVRGQALLALIVGFASFVGLSLLRVEYALPLALIAGLLEIFPTIGPVLSAIPAVIVALVSSPVLALGVIALYFLIQQLENNFVLPRVMKGVVGLDPLVTLLALMIGNRLMGIGGAILAVPFTATLMIVVEDLLAKKK